jgi:Protein of unknown function (DUF4239)
MIEAWLDFPSALLFASLAALYAATGATIVLASFSSLTAKPMRRFEGVAAPFFGAIAVLFSLLTGFLASEIADRNRQAARAVQMEASELRNIRTLSIASVSDMRAIRAAIVDYAKAALNDEWPAMAEDRQATSAAAAFDVLLREVSDPKIAQESGAAVHAGLLNAAVRVGTARSERLALASDRTNDIKWILVLILGIMTQIAIAVVHLQKRAAQGAALTIFSFAAVLALGMIALQERPFAGDVRVSPGPLVELSSLPAQ